MSCLLNTMPCRLNIMSCLLNKMPCRLNINMSCLMNKIPCRLNTMPCRVNTVPCCMNTMPCRTNTMPCRLELIGDSLQFYGFIKCFIFEIANFNNFFSQVKPLNSWSPNCYFIHFFYSNKISLKEIYLRGELLTGIQSKSVSFKNNRILSLIYKCIVISRRVVLYTLI